MRFATADNNAPAAAVVRVRVVPGGTVGGLGAAAA